MSQKARATRPAPPPRRSWKIYAVSLLALALLAALAWVLRPRPPEVPRIHAANLSSQQQERIESSRQNILSHPRSADAWGTYGMILHAFDQNRAALECFRVAESLDARNPRWPYFTSLLVAVENPRDSLSALRRAVELAGNNPEAPRFHLAEALAEQGHLEEADQQAALLLQSHPDFAPARMIRGQAAVARGELDSAREHAAAALDDVRTRKAAWSLMAAIFRRQGDAAGAAEAARHAGSAPQDKPIFDAYQAEVAQYRGDRRVFTDEVHSLLAAGKIADAAPLVARLMEEHPESPETWLVNGRMLFLQKQLPAAEAALQKHLELDPQSTQGHFQLGMVQLAANEFNKAAETFRKATELKSDFGPAWFNLGYARGRAGNFSEAPRAFREAIRHNPEHIDSYLLLADILIRQNQKEEARALLVQAEAINPDDPRLRSLKSKLAAP